ncbi:MAG: 30S ribosomal protein S15 [Nanoarchaeota archaeon]|nr:30S ribosomal protein S15 [Nanoarchaeota archaeon]MBU4123991.1 30S ribosomal protein S15 [Nanoarchaeota archaeon]
MARMYARKRGKSGSKKPVVPAQWVEHSKEEVERLVVKLAKDGLTTAQTGALLRDQYGVPSVKTITGKTILRVLKDNDACPEMPEDLLNMLKKAVRLHEHMKTFKKDNTSKHGLELLESKIRRLAKYYVKTENLPADWRYNAEQAKLIIQTVK